MDFEVRFEENSAGIKGIVENQYGEMIDSIIIEAQFFDSVDVQIADSQDVVENLANGERAEFDIPFHGENIERIDSYSVGATAYDA